MADYSSLITAAEQAFHLPPGLMHAVVHQESGGNASAVSNKGARGLAQLEPGTAKDMGVTDINDPAQNVFGGARYLRQQLDKYGNVPLALAAYNAGPGAVDRAGGIPDNGETPDYVNNILASFGGQAPSNAGVQLAQPINADQVKWDDAPASGAIDPNSVKWDDVSQAAAPSAPASAPSKPMTPRQKASDAINNTWLDQLTSGITHGVTNTLGGAIQHAGHGLGWIAEKGGAPELGDALTTGADKVSQFLTQGTPNTPAGMAGQLVGGMAVPGMNAGPTNVVNNALKAAALGAVQPVEPGQDFGQQTVKNAAVGGAGGVLGTVAGRLIGGAATPEARALMEQGITPTPGQAMGGVYRTTEEMAKSIPIVGSAITSAERAGVRQFNQAMYRDALAPINATLPADTAVGSEGVAAVRDAIGNRFNQLSQNASFTPRGAFMRDLNNIQQDLAQRSPAALNQFQTVVDQQIGQKLNQARTMTGAQWNDSRSFISGLSRDNRLGNTTPDQRALADALDDLNEAMNTQVARQSTNPQFATDLRNANNAYARYKRIETAAGSGGAMGQENVFSPAQYSAAVRKGSTNFQRATNTGLNAQQAQQAQSVLGSKYPDSGTAGRHFLGGALLGGLGHVNPTSLLGLGAGSALYATPLGRSAMLTLLARRPELLQQLGDRSAQLSPLTGVLAPQLPSGTQGQ